MIHNQQLVNNLLINEREVNKMEEKRNYVIYTSDYVEKEHVVKMTRTQANAIRWFIDYFDIDGAVELAENYEGEEI